jgi:ectoine hydroxylase-related dioxygenase (phytanoyl-CoA dioxygenase family)
MCCGPKCGRLPMADALAAAYAADGVVCLRACLDAGWVARARAGLERQNASPGPLSQRFPGRSGGAFVSHLHGWRRDADIRAVALESPLPNACAAAMGEPVLRLLYDQSFTKEPGADAPTPWHHDLPFWPVDGGPLASAWVALDPVDAESGAVAFWRGSHLWPHRFRPTQPDTPATRQLRNMDLPPAPNGWQAPAADLVQFDLAPGDVLLFDARTLHGARGNRRPDRARRALTIRYAGEGCRWVEGPHALAFETPIALAGGEALSGPDFPVAFRR